MADRTIFRIGDVQQAIADIRALLDGKTLDDLQRDRIVRAAFERFLEIISEASHHIPDELKARRPEIPWHQIKGIGNHLRHAYHRSDAAVLWDVYLHDLGALEAACADLLAHLGQSPAS